MRNPYTILGVGESASDKEIKSAFRKLAKQFHPDANRDDPKAKERFAEINHAYEIVGDEKRRAQFDRGEIDNEGKERFADFAGAGPFGGARWQQRAGGGNPFAGAGFAGADDILSELFGSAFAGNVHNANFRGGAQGGGARRGAASADIRLKANVNVEDLARGRVEVRFPDGKPVSVSIPAGAGDGQTIRLKGRGQHQPGRPPGDALVTLRFRAHERFEVRGSDLRSQVPLPLATAVKGGKLAVETLDGRISLTIPKWTTSGKTFRLKGKGLPAKGGGHGDLLIVVAIDLPDDPDQAIIDLFDKT